MKHTTSADKTKKAAKTCAFQFWRQNRLIFQDHKFWAVPFRDTLTTTGHSDWPLAPPVFPSYVSAIKGPRTLVAHKTQCKQTGNSTIPPSQVKYGMMVTYDWSAHDNLASSSVLNGRAKELWRTGDLEHPAATLLGGCCWCLCAGRKPLATFVVR